MAAGMSLARKLLPVAGPLGIAVGLAVFTSLGDDESGAPEDRAPVYTEHAPGPARPEPAPLLAARPAGPPVDRPRCLASMTVQELSRQLMTLRHAEAIARLYRDEAPPEVARAYLQGLADVSTALAPGVARSRLLVIAADGLVRLGHAQPARTALAASGAVGDRHEGPPQRASRELPPPHPGDYGFDRSDWRGHAAQVAARLDDHALAEALVADDPEAAVELAQHYAEVGELGRARALLQAAAPEHPSLGWRLAHASALVGVGQREAALAEADGFERSTALVRLEVARTLIRGGHHEDAVAVLLAAADGMPATLEPGERLGTMVAIARELDAAGRLRAALERLDHVRTELQALGDHFQALGVWAALIDAEHRLGRTEQAWEDVAAFGGMSLADMNAAPMTRVLLLTREGRLAEALTVTHATAAITYPLAYAHIHARMREPDPTLERELDEGLRTFCPGG
jgi:tetratricopeptide (TPR) repeat protein